MMFLTHLFFGILSGFLACSFLGCNNQLLFVAVAAIASAFPDIDHLSSKISRKIPPLSVVISFLFSHRGFMHSLIVPVLLYFAISRISELIAAAVLVGYTSHLLLDATTTKGIRFFYPLRFKVKGIIKTNSFLEKLVAIILLIITIVVMFSEISRFL
ncbi:MAG: metal-dependent hydrolase [archaeon]